MRASHFLGCLLGVVFLALPAFADQPVPWGYNFQPPATPVMERLEAMHEFLLYIITAVTLFVLGLLFYTCVRFRRSANPVASKTTHNTTIEVIWTVVPIAILVVIAVPSLKLHYFMDVQEKPDMTLKIIGRQWYWEYEYPDQGGITFESRIKQDKDLVPGEPRLLAVDNPIVVPVGKVVQIHVTGGDVIHAWAMPAFGVKVDAIPGRLNESWFKVTTPGTYYGQCSELCGVDHGFMPIMVKAVSEEEFNRWVEEKKKAAELAVPALSSQASLMQ